MLSSAYDIHIRQNREEQTQRGTELFPCSVYRGDIQKYPMGYLPVHWHKELELFLLDAGKVKISTGQEEFTLCAGEGYFSNSGTLHGISPMTDAPCHFHSIVFDTSLISGAEGSIYDVKYMRPFLTEGAPIYPLRSGDGSARLVLTDFEKAFTLCAEEPQCYELTVRELLSRIIVALTGMELSQCDSNWSEQVQRMKQMVSWIEEHYEHPVTVEQIASAHGISVRECQRSFQKIMNISPMHYVTRHRITVAANLLRTTRRSISEIGGACGFDSSSYFAKQFKTLMGLTPKEYRKKETENEI